MSSDAKNPHYALMDVGSTVVKLAEVTPAGEILRVHRFAHEVAMDFMGRWHAADILRCYVAEPSDKPNLARLEEQLRTRHVPYRLLRKTGRLPIENLYADGQAGIDRLANAVAVHGQERFPAVIVDAGSAITVDLVDEYGRFAGGSILPGIGLQMWALGKARTSLPVPEILGNHELTDMPGKNTTDAIRVGVLHGLTGAINHLVSQGMKQFSSGQPNIIFTGGDGERFLNTAYHGGIYMPNLTLDGLWLIARERYPEDF